MKNKAAVDVFLGHPLSNRTELHFLERLRRDLVMRGTCARILANLEVGRDYRQLDFLIVTDQRAVMCELKGMTDPVIGRVNGRWERKVGGTKIPYDGNPLRQAQDINYALSDTMHGFARGATVLGPQKKKFFKDIDAVVCLFPTVPDGSEIQKHPYVSVVGYDKLLERLHHRGPAPQWSDGDWDRFIRHLGLYRDEEDSEGYRARRVTTEAVEEYRARFIAAYEIDQAPFVATKVRVDGAPAERPDLATELVAGRGIVLIGESGLGKSLWGQMAAKDLARAGHVPIWIDARASHDSFRTSLARAIARYTTLGASELLSAAESAGRAAVFIVDGLNESTAAARKSLIAGAQAMRLRSETRGLLITTQRADEVPDSPDLLWVELLLPDDAERRAVLAAYSAEEAIDQMEAFTTPLELSLAAECASEVADLGSSARLLDRYVDRLAASEATRSLLRAVAWRMHAEIRLGLGTSDVVRMARRDLGLEADEVDAALACRLLALAQGRLSFCHERFARFLAAEALLLRHEDPESLARELNQPQAALLRRDVVALEDDEGRLGVILTELEDADVLVEAATGLLGITQQRIARSVFVDALKSPLRERPPVRSGS